MRFYFVSKLKIIKFVSQSKENVITMMLQIPHIRQQISYFRMGNKKKIMEACKS